MSDFKTFASDRVHVVTVQLVGRGKTDRVNETVKFRPGFGQLCEHGVDAFIFCHIALQNDV